MSASLITPTMQEDEEGVTSLHAASRIAGLWSRLGA